MGKRTIDKSKKIENKNQRQVAFCKRKRGFLKKAIEMSRLCDQQIFMIMYDAEKDKVVQFSSDSQFSFQRAYDVVRRIKKSTNARHNYESYNNGDYDKFQLVDFRTIRYQGKGESLDEEDPLIFEEEDIITQFNNKGNKKIKVEDVEEKQKSNMFTTN